MITVYRSENTAPKTLTSLYLFSASLMTIQIIINSARDGAIMSKLGSVDAGNYTERQTVPFAKIDGPKRRLPRPNWTRAMGGFNDKGRVMGSQSRLGGVTVPPQALARLLRTASQFNYHPFSNFGQNFTWKKSQGIANIISFQIK